MSGATRALAVRVIDLRTQRQVQEQRLGRCFENVVAVSGAEERCIVFEYDQDTLGRPLRFEYDFASRRHYPSTESTYALGDPDHICTP